MDQSLLGNVWNVCWSLLIHNAPCAGVLGLNEPRIKDLGWSYNVMQALLEYLSSCSWVQNSADIEPALWFWCRHRKLPPLLLKVNDLLRKIGPQSRSFRREVLQRIRGPFVRSEARIWLSRKIQKEKRNLLGGSFFQFSATLGLPTIWLCLKKGLPHKLMVCEPHVFYQNCQAWGVDPPFLG